MATKVKWKQYIDSTLLKRVNMLDSDGNPYFPGDGDKLVFHICQHFEDEQPLLEKEIPIDSRVLYVELNEWRNFPRNSNQEWIYGEYYYDIHYHTLSEDGYEIAIPLQIGKFVLLNKVMDKVGV